MSNFKDIRGGAVEIRYIKVGSRYQAVLPFCFLPGPVPTRSYEYSPYDDSIDPTCWIPTDKISDSELEHYLEVSRKFYKYAEDQALTVLYTLDYDISLALVYMQLAAVPHKVATQSEINFFDRSIVRDGKLSSFNHLFPPELMDELFAHYYNTKAFLSRSLIDIATQLNYDDTAIFRLFLGDIGEESRLGLPFLNSDTFLQLLHRSMSDSKFELNKHLIYEKLYNYREEQLRQIQFKQRMIEHKVNVLCGKSDVFFNYQDRLDMARANPKWNRLEVILLVQLLRKYGPEYKKIAKELYTKDERQISHFCIRHRDFLRSISETDDDQLKHQMVKDYIQRALLPQTSSSSVISGPGPSWIASRVIHSRVQPLVISSNDSS